MSYEIPAIKGSFAEEAMTEITLEDIDEIRNRVKTAIISGGQKVLYRSGVVCPCLDSVNELPMWDCDLCYGLGWTYPFDVETRVMLVNRGIMQKYGTLGNWEVGTAFATIPEEISPSVGDRLIVYNEIITISDITFVKGTTTRSGRSVERLPFSIIDKVDFLIAKRGNSEMLGYKEGISYKIDKNGFVKWIKNAPAPEEGQRYSMRLRIAAEYMIMEFDPYTRMPYETPLPWRVKMNRFRPRNESRPVSTFESTDLPVNDPDLHV